MANPIPSSEEFHLDWLASELDEWKGIQEMINESQQREDDRVIHHSWLSDVPDRIPSTNPGAEPPRDARDSGSARLHSTHLETSSSDRP